MRLPGAHQRLAIVGKTGSGKTQAALWQLSQQELDVFPWLILDYKKEPMIERIPGLQTIDLEDSLPEDAGLYRVCPQPQQEEDVSELLWNVWRRENMGVFVDEGYMVSARNDAFNALITQGRSKNIPMIILSQRPAWVSRFVFSEADFLQIFHLNDERDRSTVQSFLPSEVDVSERLPLYHSYYYDVAADEVLVLRPVPNEDAIMDDFAGLLLPAQVEVERADSLRFI